MVVSGDCVGEAILHESVVTLDDIHCGGGEW